MPGKQGEEAGVAAELGVSVGFDFARFRGLQTQNDAGATPKDAFRDLTNVRLRGGRVTDRGGQAAVTTTPVAACLDGMWDVGPYSPGYTMSVSAGDGQSAAAGAAVAVDPAVLVVDDAAAPVVGLLVTFSVVDGGGSVVGGSQYTNASGIATVTSWTLGPLAGANALQAVAAGVDPVTFSATATGVGAGVYGSGGSVNYWNGAVGAQSLSSPGRGDLLFSGGKVYFCEANDPGTIREFAGASWTTKVTEAAGVVYENIIKVGSTFYLLTVAGDIRSWDGSASTTALVSAAKGSESVSALATDGTNLYVLSSFAMSVWKFDGATWTEMLPELPVGETEVLSLFGVAVLAGTLYVIGIGKHLTGGSPAYINTTYIWIDDGLGGLAVDHKYVSLRPPPVAFTATPVAFNVSLSGIALYYAVGTSLFESGYTKIEIGVLEAGVYYDCVNVGGTLPNLGTPTGMRLLVTAAEAHYSNYGDALQQWSPDFSGTATSIDVDRPYFFPALVE